MRSYLAANLAADLSSGLPARVPGANLIRALAGAALSASAIAAAALTVALSAPAPAHAETAIPGVTAQQHGFSLPGRIAPRFGPGLVAVGASDLFVHPGPLGPAPAPRATTPHFQVESDDDGIATVYRLRDYDLRLEYGTVFYRTAVLPGQPTSPAVSRGRLMSRVVTRF